MADDTIVTRPSLEVAQRVTPWDAGMALPPITGVPAPLARRLEMTRDAWYDESSQRRSFRDRLSYARGDQISSSLRMPDEPVDHAAKKPRFAANLLGFALDLLSYIYAQDPVRTATAPDVWSARVWDYGIGLTAILDAADPWIRLCGECLVYGHPGWSRAPQERGAWEECDGADLLIVTPDEYVAVPHEYDPRWLGSVAIRHSESPLIHEYMDDEYLVILEEWQPVTVIEHRLGGVPAGLLPNTIELNGGRGVAMGGGSDDVIDSFKSLNRHIVEMLYTGVLQRGQWVFRGGQLKGDLGPDTVITIGEDESLDCQTLGASIGAMVDALATTLALTGKTLHLPARAFEIRHQRDVSATAIVTDRIELQEDRRRRRRVAERVWEPTCARVAALVLEPWGFSLDHTSVTVRFPELAPPLTHEETLAQTQWEYEQSLISRREARERLSPWLTPDEIDERLSEADADREKDVAERALVAGHGAGASDASTDESIQGAVPVDEVQKTALNGAQIESLRETLLSVARGEFGEEAATIMLLGAFPSFSESDVRRMVSAAAREGSTPPTASEVIDV